MADNIKQASKKSQHQSKVAMLDSLGTDKTEFLDASFFTEAEKVSGDFIERVKTNINNADLVVTGGIEDMSIAVDEANKKIYIKGNDYLLFIDRGVNGSEEKKYNTPHSYTDKRPPTYVFKNYIKTKNIQLRYNENYLGKPSPFEDLDGQEKAIDSAAYAMATKIFKEGFKPQPIFAKEIPKLISDLKQVIPNFLAKGIIQQINAKANDSLFPTKDWKP